MQPREPDTTVTVHGTRIISGESRAGYREKIARITLDSMVQFVGLLDAHGTVLEINKVALDAVGVDLAEVEGRPFWTTFWWQVSLEVNQGIRDAIARAAKGEFVRWDTPIYGRAGGTETIIIDASVMPVKDERGEVVFLVCEGRDITEKKAYEQEIARQREELAQLDKLKTQFFANISHEFRTPLTLMMGPLEDMLAERSDADPRLELAHRNSLRLLKLVNTLLDFSRIEAGRIQASYEPTDLSVLTADLASNFRAAIERAGMTLSIECQPLPEPIYVDREMWEKIVLNLLSNAFKFTFEGEIGVSLRAVGNAVELEVRDSGTGIPTEELQKIFERFHRVKAARGRSYEGSGIGLALVQELARLHGGAVSVRSEVGRGSSFTVCIPFGKDHLPAARIEAARGITSTTVRADAFVQEALRWLPDEPSDTLKDGEQSRTLAGESRQRILLADDNADLRDYVRRLLEVSYTVEVVDDGVAALESARARPPDLIISDVMMPKLDGFGLIRELRADRSLATVPVMILSARAGEEARIEGLSRGADDYLMKPFSARDLLSRVAATLKSEGMRQRVLEQERRFRTFVQASSDIVYSMSPDWSEMRYLQGRDFIANTTEPIRSWFDKYIHPEDQQRVRAAIQDAIRGKKTFELEHRVLRVDGTLGWTFSRGIPILSPDGDIVEWLGAASDITARKQGESALREADQRKDEFLATLSHELRNPLAPIRNGLQLMRLQGDRPNPKVHDIMERQLNHLVRLVDDLLEISRITRGLLELRRERVELASIVRNAVETSQPLIHASSHRLDVALPSEALWLTGDPVRLTQVLGNVLNNAAKYTDNGGTIALSVRRDGQTAVISVRDNGCGITRAGLERIFEMFSREVHAKERSQGGLGIGLTLSRRLVEMHGGTIEARSEGEGCGSEFIVRLPLAKTSVRAEEAAPVMPRLAALRILVVDDNEDAASTLGMLLEALGADVDVMNDGRSGLESFAARGHSVVLLDLGMPEMDGYEVARAMRSRFPERRPTIIALTGRGQPEDRRMARDAGIDHHLVKPAQLEVLRELLNEVVAARGEAERS
ncbi:MAG TPA: ATP-binding protein [Polyangiales bacterium]|nr:ATP-binding protein [Polyangiales bacterium]